MMCFDVKMYVGEMLFSRVARVNGENVWGAYERGCFYYECKA